MASPLHICTPEELCRLLTETEMESLPGFVLGEGSAVSPAGGVPDDDSEVQGGASADTSPALPAAVTAWLVDILTTACDRVVSAVNACESNTRIAYGARKVPAACVHTALVLARHAVIACLPGMSDTLEGSSRAAEYKTACSDLARLAACELDAGDYADASPADPDVDATSSGVGVICRPAMEF